jgi:hypothetical protein
MMKVWAILYGKLVSLGSSCPKMGFKEVSFGSNIFVGPKPLNEWFISYL